MIKVTAQDILITHIQICHSIGRPAELKKPNVLNEIESQLNTNLMWFSSVQTAAYIGMQIVKRRPFEYANNATAVALTVSLLKMNGTKVAPGVITKTDSILSDYSVVDDVVDQLLLAGAK